MSENVDECRYYECCSDDERDFGCNKYNGYKGCGVYRMFVELKKEYDKMGVVKRFNFIAKLSEVGG